MFEIYKAWNRKFVVILWGLVIVCMLASLPLVFERNKMEAQFKDVEFVMDYRDLLDISVYHTNPGKFVDEQLEQLKRAQVPSLAVYESTLTELAESRRVELYSSHEAAALLQKPGLPNENFTYVLFTEPTSQEQLLNLILPAFKKLNVPVHEWSYNSNKGLIIEMQLDEASMKPMDPDPVTLQMLKDKGFNIVIRLSNRREFVATEMDQLLTTLTTSYGVKSMIVDGDAAPGFMNEGRSSENIVEMGNLMTKHHMGLAIIEPLNLKSAQRGVTTLAKQMDYNVFRLHSISELDADKLTENIPEKDIEVRIRAIADRVSLAVKDRNVRMVLLNAKPSKNPGKATFTDPLKPLFESLMGEEGALNQIQNNGFSLGDAHSLDYHPASWQKKFKPFAIVGSVALIALLIAAFLPYLLLPIFAVGLLGSAALSVLSLSVLQQVLALGVGICAVSLAIITLIKTLRKQSAKPAAETTSFSSRHARIAFLYIRTAVISLLGAIFIVSLLNNITYNLVIQQFKGVNILAFAPLLVTGLYLLLFSERMSYKQITMKAKRILNSSVSVIWIVVAVLFVGISLYYLSRTGNEGTASPFELMFRSFLENTLKVRPRTKEFLIGNPLLILGIYLCFKGRLNALYLIVIGVIGQASLIGSFTHLHTPLLISMIRGIYGMVIGAFIALLLIGIWELCTRSWKRWGHLLNA
ncbi:hypothetical protein EHS13_00445 [Paenibacillus psychroresistens]|uniref:Beta-carotene 15,15'-monooxygenase n=1 Tax=Paenibacillus psychroresistens TaxID=1778678 RepID=A0A6B8RDD8_9BACL|nr:DUF5693 family protein [Paenibacillus psychroresistens]QGQ93502.1 hypothetical protein EHS13_00445 [Paenibacillus psychroresistens]